MTAARWTTQQVLDLATDGKSVAAARTLTSPRTWSQLGCTGTLVWGRCQGSAREPYQVTVDLTEPAFRCSCPSRKFPCKHGLALLLLWVEHGDAVGEVAAAADFAGEWAEQRTAKRAARRAGDEAGAGSRAVADPEAQAAREAKREAAMSAGIDEFDRWLGDLARQGLAAARRQPYGFWDATAGRLVDAQLPGLAERVRQTGGAVQAREDWADHLVAECGRWCLAVRAWRRRTALAPDVVADLRAFIGWPRRPDEVARFATLRDRWVVAGVSQATDGRLLSQRTWLWGQQSDRWVVLLDFAAAGAALRVAQVVGSVVDDELTLYPGSDPVRAALSGDHQVVGSGAAPHALAVTAAADRLGTWLAANPWSDRLPLPLKDVVLAEEADRWSLHDDGGHRVPVAADQDPWLLLSVSGGQHVTVTAEWDGGEVRPLAVFTPEPMPL